MNRKEYYGIIEDELTKIKVIIDNGNKLNLTDNNIFLEDIMSNILNIIFDVSLINTNLNIGNYPSIDLKDEKNKVAIQVTTDTKRKKITDTLEKFFENKYDKVYDKLYIVVFDETTYNKDFLVPSNYNFKKDENIITYSKLLNKIEHLSDDKLKKIYDYVILCLQNNIYSTDWTLKNSNKSINNLDKRYNKELNVYNEETQKIKMYFSCDECKNEIIKKFKEIIILIENNGINTNINISNIMNKFNQKVLEDYLKIIDEKKEMVIKKYEQGNFYKISIFEDKYNEIIDTIRKLVKSFSSKILIYRGVAGIGKSHTIASYLYKEYLEKGIPALLVLGQDFGNSENIENQFCNITSGKNDIDEMLYYLNELGKVRSKIIPIVIDGINESKDKSIWKKGLNNFIELIKKYSNLKLLLSIRDTYYDFCIPETIKNDNDTLIYIHEGFKNNNISAAEEFFKFYNINIPIFKIINNEFSNPLFLTLYCSIIQKYKIDINKNEYLSFVKIFRMLLNKISEKFNEKYCILSNPNVIKDIINIYIEKLIENDKNITEKDFLLSINEVSNLYDLNKKDILNFLIEEEIFYKEVRNDKEVIIFTYERYEKICLAFYLLDKISSIEDLKYSIESGILMNYVYNSDKFDNGILEELINIVHEEYKIDFISLITFEKTSSYIIRDYIKSLLWYKGQYSKDNIIENVKKISQDVDFINDLIDIFLKMSYIEDNPLNICFLNEKLLNLSMIQRDYYWSIAIDNYYSKYNSKTIDNIFEYCLNYGGDYLNEHSRYLLSILLSWLFTSSNRYLRDMSTKSLVKLIIDNHKLSINLLNNFKNVNDYYVLERVIVSIYGSVLRSVDNENIEELASIFYNTVYKNDKIIDNIIIKIYAKKLFYYLKHNYSINLYDNIEKELKSDWYQKLPTNEEIDKYEKKFVDENDDKSKYSTYLIIHSMVTEYGRGLSAYGDFGRYKFEYLIEPFKYLFDDVQLLANKVTERVFEYGYDYRLFGDYDLCISNNLDRNEHYVERIGKKYQWIATYELLSKLYDNFNSLYRLYDDDIIDFSKYEYFDINHERTLDESNVSYIKYDYEVENDGIMNIDPTNFIFQQKDYKESLNTENFVLNKEEEYSKYIIKNLNDVKYVSLYNLVAAEDRPFSFENIERTSFTLICTAFVYSNREQLEKSDYKSFSCGNFNEMSNIQLFDVPNSLEYRLRDDRISKEQNLEMGFKTCYDEYIWGSEYDESSQRDMKILLPQKWIIDDFNLKQKNEGEWYKDDELLCFQPNLKDGKQELVIKYDEFINYLNEHNLKLGWTIYCEKTNNYNFNTWRTNIFYNYVNESFEYDNYEHEER